MSHEIEKLTRQGLDAYFLFVTLAIAVIALSIIVIMLPNYSVRLREKLGSQASKELPKDIAILTLILSLGCGVGISYLMRALNNDTSLTLSTLGSTIWKIFATSVWISSAVFGMSTWYIGHVQNLHARMDVFRVCRIHGTSATNRRWLDSLSKWEIEEYGGDLTVNSEGLWDWYQKCNQGAYLYFHGEKLIGAMGIWPIREQVFNDLKPHRLKESDLTADHIEASLDHTKPAYFYIGDIILVRAYRRPHHGALLMKQVMDAFKKTWRLSDNQTVYMCAIAASTIGVRMLQKAGFENEEGQNEVGAFYSMQVAGPEIDETYFRVPLHVVAHDMRNVRRQPQEMHRTFRAQMGYVAVPFLGRTCLKTIALSAWRLVSRCSRKRKTR